MQQHNSADRETISVRMDMVKRSLVRYVGRESMNYIAGKLDDVVSKLNLNSEEHDNFLKTMLETVDGQLYSKQQEKNREAHLLERGKRLPCFPTKHDPYAMNGADLSLLDDEDKKRLQNKHNDIITAVKRIAVDMETTAESPYNFLMHPQEVYESSLRLWGNDLTRCRENTTWSLNMMRILQFMNIVGIPSDDLYSMFKEGQIYAMDHTERPSPKRKNLTVVESQELRELNKNEFYPQALEKLSDPDICTYDGPMLPGKIHRMKLVHDAIEALYLYGSTAEHTLQRADLVDIKYSDAETNPENDNFVKIENEKVSITMNTLHKVKPGGKRAKKTKLDQALVLDVSKDNPLFAKLLIQYKDICAEIHGHGPKWLLFQYQKELKWGQKLKANALTCRNKRLYRGTAQAPANRGVLSSEIALRAGGLNPARNAAQINLMNSDPTFQEQEINARNMGRPGATGVATSHEHYGREDTLQPGTQVRLHSLKTTNLNNQIGIVDCFDSTKDRYRVVLDNLSAGLFKQNNLEILDSQIDFTDLHRVNSADTTCEA